MKLIKKYTSFSASHFVISAFCLYLSLSAVNAGFQVLQDPKVTEPFAGKAVCYILIIGFSLAAAMLIKELYHQITLILKRNKARNCKTEQGAAANP